MHFGTGELVQLNLAMLDRIVFFTKMEKKYPGRFQDSIDGCTSTAKRIQAELEVRG